LTKTLKMWYLSFICVFFTQIIVVKN